MTILGKGPSLNFVAAYRNSIDNTITLNHTCEIFAGNIAHFTDLEALIDCSKTITSSKSFVVMPFYPHIRGVPTNRNLIELSNEHPLLNQLIVSDRIFTYSGSNSRNKYGLPEIELRFFSIEPAYQIACLLGASKILTFGVDGGSKYSNFVSQRGKTRLLENGRKTFDSQFDQLSKLKKRFKVEMEPAMKPIQIFIGASDTELIPFLVLKNSIETQSSHPVVVKRLPLVKIKPKNRKNRSRTPFSFSRFLIPSLMNFEGKAIYLDSDMLVFSDIFDLYSHDLKGKAIGVTVQNIVPEKWTNDKHFSPGRQLSVLIIDCEKAKWEIEQIVDSLNRGAYSYQDLLYSLKIVPDHLIDESLDPDWNSLEHFENDKTKLLHFTVMPTQPWRTRDNPNYYLWIEALQRAIIDGAVRKDDLNEAQKIGSIGRHVIEDTAPVFLQNSKFKTEDHLIRSPKFNLFKILRFRITAAAVNSMWRAGEQIRLFKRRF